MSDTPLVYIACLACYNAGRLVGEHYDLSDGWDPEEQGTPEQIHGGAAKLARLVALDGGSPHEEYVVHDHENVPVKGEFGLAMVQAIADAYEEVGDTQWDAYCAYVDTGLWGHGSVPLPDASEFTNAYKGEADSFRDFIYNGGGYDPFEEYTDKPSQFGERGPTYIPEDSPIRQYFNWEQYADEQENDNYAVVKIPGGGVYVFETN